MKQVDNVFEKVMQSLIERSKNKPKEEKLTSVKYECELCKDTGGIEILREAGTPTVYRNHLGEFIKTTRTSPGYEWVECECQEIKKVNRMIKSSEITEEFQSMTFSNFEENKVHPDVGAMKSAAIQYYKSYAEIKKHKQNSIMFVGQPGCGKTHLLTALSNNFMNKKKIPVLYFPYRDGMNNISENNFARKNEIIDKMKEVEILFIDDLFKPIGTKIDVKEWQVNIMFEVINYRYLNKKPLFISTELPIEEILTIDEALGSRIFEMAQDFYIKVAKNQSNNYRLRRLRGE